MIVNLSQRYVNVASESARDLGADVCVIADRQSSLSVLVRKVEEAVQDGRAAFTNWRWYRPVDQAPAWFEEFAGSSRADLDGSEAARARFFELLGTQFPAGPLIAPTGQMNDIARAMSLAREMVTVRNASFSDRPVFASVAVDRQGLQDPAVLSQVTIPVGIEGVFVTVLDSATYPSVWSAADWLAWLRFVGSLERAGHRVILDCADARGLIALGLGDFEFTTGTSQGDRQAPVDPGSSGGSGASAPVAYFSAPLISVMHGENVAVDPTATLAAENHRDCGAFGGIGFPQRAASFDPDWLLVGGTVGERTGRRYERHFADLNEVEGWIRAQRTRPEAVEALLQHAHQAGENVGQQNFKSAGSKAELASRLQGYRDARAALGI